MHFEGLVVDCLDEGNEEEDAGQSEIGKAFAKRILARKAVRDEMEEGRNLLNAIQTTAERWERKIAKSDRRGAVRVCNSFASLPLAAIGCGILSIAH